MLKPYSANYFYSFLYHVLCHKKSVSKKYRDKISMLASNINISLTKDQLESDKFLFDLLKEYMKKNNYTFVRPDEQSIAYRSSHDEPATYGVLD